MRKNQYQLTIYKIFILALACILHACSGSSSKTQKAEQNHEQHADEIITLNEGQFSNAGIVLGTVSKASLSSILKVSGRIDVPPQNMVSVSIPMGGYLQDTKLLPGLHLNKGEVIAIMEDQQYIQLQQDYLTAKANFAYLEGEYLRQKELNISKASSDKVFEQARAAYQTQKIMISALAEKLKLIGINPATLNENNISKSIKVYSPINGFVSKVNINIGKYVTPSDILFELVNPADIHLNMMVFEKDVDKLYIGQKVIAYTNGNPEKKYPCDIILVGKNVSGERYVEVHCHFENYDKMLIPGMYMNAEVQVKSAEASVLPEEAVLRFEGKDYVFLETGHQQYEMKEVKTGLKDHGKIEIVDPGILDQKQVVVKGAYTLLMMSKNKGHEDH
jgi:cobalt-zinc-cadmium efflux system membrane fusion protein